jgi:N-acetylmuramoyl-L-alanine amidase
LGLGVKTVVIDPGHGGKDPGAKTCVKGLVEKDITLRVALKLAQSLRKKLGLKVVLTRTKDVFVPLEERTAIANTHQADLFISIHVNAAEDRRLQGVETYFLNLATDERAIELAARENATSTKSISDLQNILNDLMLNTKINESNRLAFQTQRQLMEAIKETHPGAKSLGVKQAPFYVLLGAQMPAVLVEIGFGTNPKECKRLASSRYLEKVAIGIGEGLAAYISQTRTGG